MTIAEFNAWLEGYGEAIGDAPTPEQWEKIRAKLATIAPLMPAYVYPPNTVTQPYTLDRPYRVTSGQISCANVSQ